MKLKDLNHKALKTLEELAGKKNRNKQVRLDAAVSIINLALEERDRKKEKEVKGF